MAKKQVEQVKTEVNGNKVLGRTDKESLANFTARAIKDYGSEVIEQRALPDFRDGLKPVHRYILYAMYRLHINSSGGFKKSARIIGDVIGKYSPHGDGSTYQAMVGITGVKLQGRPIGWNSRNCNVPLIEGTGNWGDFISSAAAYRYTEARLSKFSDIMLLDPNYMAVIDYIPNYDESEKMPVILPAKLPVMLLNGYQSIAVGVAASCPSFSIKGVVILTKKALAGEKITSKLCANVLKFEFPYGGTCETPIEDLTHIFKGKGSAQFIPDYTIDRTKRTIKFTSVCPGLMSSGTLQTFLEKLSNLKGVSSVEDLTDKSGVCYLVTAQRGVKDKVFDDFVEDCLNTARRSDSYDIGITIRSSTGAASFKKVSIPEMLEMWAKWRIELEIKVLNRLLAQNKEKLEHNNLLLLAVNNLDVIIKALQVKKDTAIIRQNGVDVEVNSSAAYLIKHLKITLEQAMVILNLKLIALRSMESKKISKTIQSIKVEIKDLEKDLKSPGPRIIKDLDSFNFTNL